MPIVQSHTLEPTVSDGGGSHSDEVRDRGLGTFTGKRCFELLAFEGLAQGDGPEIGSLQRGTDKGQGEALVQVGTEAVSRVDTSTY